jgi:uncharacterized integral membrane protein
VTPKRIVFLVLFLLVAATGGVFTWQNLPTRVNAVFKITPDLAWDLGASGQPLVVLLGIALGAGILLTFLMMFGRMSSASRDARKLRRQVESLKDELEFARDGGNSMSGGPV